MVGYVGYGKSYPQRVYHKAASIPSKLMDDDKYNCLSGKQWLLYVPYNPCISVNLLASFLIFSSFLVLLGIFFSSKAQNPNLLVGAVVGGPNRNDTYFDDRQKRGQSEPKTHINAVWAGLLAGLSTSVRPGIGDYTRMWVGLPFALKKAAYIQARIPKYSPPPPNPNTPVEPGAPPFDTTPPAGPQPPAGVTFSPPPTPDTVKPIT